MISPSWVDSVSISIVKIRAMFGKSLSAVRLLAFIELEWKLVGLALAQRSTIEFIRLIREEIHAYKKSLAREYDACFDAPYRCAAGKFIFGCSD